MTLMIAFSSITENTDMGNVLSQINQKCQSYHSTPEMLCSKHPEL